MPKYGEDLPGQTDESNVIPFDRSGDESWEAVDDITLALKRLAVLSSETYRTNLLPRLARLAEKRGEEVAKARLTLSKGGKSDRTDHADDSTEKIIADAKRVLADADDQVKLRVLEFVENLYETARYAKSPKVREYTEDLVSRILFQ